MDTTIDQYEKLLDSNDFERIDLHLLKNNKHIPTDQLYDSILDSNTATYDYILDIRLREFAKDNNIWQSKLDKYIQALEELKKDTIDPDFIGKQTWLREIDEAMILIRRGIKVGWHNI
jgi:hypothetical protein